MTSSVPISPITGSNRVAARLSDPACRYVAALYDTKSCAEPPSVPSGCQLSQKIKTFNRGSFSTGTTGFGMIQVQPTCMAVNNAPPVGFSTTTTVATSATLGGAYTNMTNGGNCNAPFSTGSYGSSAGLLAFKLIGCTLYLKYAGTELNRGGDMILVEEPNHRSLNLYSYNTAMGFDYAKRVPMSTEWVSVSFTPNRLSTAAGAPLVDETTYVAVDPSTVGTIYLGAFVNTAGASQPIDYECYCWYEVVGALARGATSSYEDPIGAAAIWGACEMFQQLDSVLGLDGFIHAIENQLDNQSGVSRDATHKQNWAGLAAFLPQLADVATRALSGAASGALKEFGYKKVKPTRTLAPPAPPAPPARKAQALTASLLKAAVLRKKK